MSTDLVQNQHFVKFLTQFPPVHPTEKDKIRHLMFLSFSQSRDIPKMFSHFVDIDLC